MKEKSVNQKHNRIQMNNTKYNVENTLDSTGANAEGLDMSHASPEKFFF